MDELATIRHSRGAVFALVMAAERWDGEFEHRTDGMPYG